MVTQEILLQKYLSMDEIFAQKQNIMDHVRALNLSRKGLEFCEKCLFKRETPDNLLRCKGFKINKTVIQNELLILCKKVEK